MEAAVVLALGTLLLLVVLSPILALVALARVSRLEKRLEGLAAAAGPIAGEAAGDRRAEGGARPAADAGHVPPPRATPSPPRSTAPPPDPEPAAPAVAPLPPLPAGAHRDGQTAAAFVTTVGPRILVASGGLAVLVFVGLFVRYAWENDWVGPAGRVLCGATFSLGLVGAGLRFIRGVYRPLGQGLAATGFAGLYVSAYAAHGFYDLVPRAVSATLMIAVTVCAVAVADRLGARLLAALAWTGAYLTPVLVSTGEDRAESLFSYLLLIGAGALWLDRRKPWPETLPLAFTGTLLLYGGWYAAHFRPERFGVAALGLVALTSLFALGAAHKERSAGFAVVLLAATLGLAAFGTDADRPEVLLPLSLVLAGAGLRAARSMGPGVAAAAAVGAGLPFLAWSASHYHPGAFGLAAAWVVGGALLLIAGAPRLPAPVFPVAALVAGGAATVDLAVRTDRPLALLALVLAQAGLAVLARRRWVWAEVAGVSLAAVAVLSWLDRWYQPEQAGRALLLAGGLALAWVAVLAVRGLVAGIPLGRPEAVTHIVAAALVWQVLDVVVGRTWPDLHGPAAAALAAFHLILGLVARRARQPQPLWTQVNLGLAAVFLTLSIPVQLGLVGITLAWAAEALLLLWLGLRHGSWWARAGGYGVLALAVGRLLLRHLPLHEGAFTPVLNPVFGTWLLVIAAVGLASRMVAPLREEGRLLDRAAATLLAPLGLGLLFVLLTAETTSVFDQRARQALAAGRSDAAVLARRQGGLALSVLWTVFATGLLAGGLALRRRGLFYTAYGLFAVTAFKVVMVDLATMPTLYRMLSFLALGVLLLAGAWLNLRFRERLVPPGGDA